MIILKKNLLFDVFKNVILKISLVAKVVFVLVTAEYRQIFGESAGQSLKRRYFN